MPAFIVLEIEVKAKRKISHVNNPLIPDIPPRLFCSTCSKIATQNDARRVRRSKIQKSIPIHKNDGCNNASATFRRKLRILQGLTIFHGCKAEVKTEMNQNP